MVRMLSCVHVKGAFAGLDAHTIGHLFLYNFHFGMDSHLKEALETNWNTTSESLLWSESIV